MITHSDSFELILPDDEAFNEVFINSFDEIIPDEMGVDIANSEDIEERSNTVMDEEQALNFPPWKVQRLMLDLKGLSIDAGTYLYDVIIIACGNAKTFHEFWSWEGI